MGLKVGLKKNWEDEIAGSIGHEGTKRTGQNPSLLFYY